VYFFRATKITSEWCYLNAKHRFQENLIYRLILVDIDCSYLLKPHAFRTKSINIQNFSHPVIHNGVLYIRHGEALIAYSEKGRRKAEIPKVQKFWGIFI
jgi:hypothetical protein